jgi:hypothetical protein
MSRSCGDITACSTGRQACAVRQLCPEIRTTYPTGPSDSQSIAARQKRSPSATALKPPDRPNLSGREQPLGVPPKFFHHCGRKIFHPVDGRTTQGLSKPASEFPWATPPCKRAFRHLLHLLHYQGANSILLPRKAHVRWVINCSNSTTPLEVIYFSRAQTRILEF